MLQCTEMEEYMAQYGYRAPHPPPDPAIFDVFSRRCATTAPAAAADLAVVNSEDQPASAADDARSDGGPAHGSETEQQAAPPAIQGINKFT
jgi:hypothetical protein